MIVNYMTTEVLVIEFFDFQNDSNSHAMQFSFSTMETKVTLKNWKENIGIVQGCWWFWVHVT
jgi:hypothetical protein